MSIALPFIHRDLLIPHERAVRRPLAHWATEISGNLELGRRNLAGDAARGAIGIMSCFNQAALVEVHFGRKEHARQLCMYSLAWLRELAGQSGKTDCYRNGFQPFVNLARLDRINGLWADALLKLDVLRQALFYEPVSLMGLTISDQVLHLILADEQFVSVLTNMCTIDRLKTLLKAEMYGDIFDLAALSTPGTFLHQFLTEARSIALCCCGEADKALELNRQSLSDNKFSNQPVFLFRAAEALAACGRTDQALVTLRLLKGLFDRARSSLGANDETLSNRLVLLHKTSSLLLHLGATQESRDLAGLGHKFALQLGDVLLTCDCLEVMRLSGLHELEGRPVAELQREMKRAAWYGIAGRADSAVSEHATSTMDTLYQRLAALSTQTAPRPAREMLA